MVHGDPEPLATIGETGTATSFTPLPVKVDGCCCRRVSVRWGTTKLRRRLDKKARSLTYQEHTRPGTGHQRWPKRGEEARRQSGEPRLARQNSANRKGGPGDAVAEVLGGVKPGWCRGETQRMVNDEQTIHGPYLPTAPGVVGLIGLVLTTNPQHVPRLGFTCPPAHYLITGNKARGHSPVPRDASLLQLRPTLGLPVADARLATPVADAWIGASEAS